MTWFGNRPTPETDAIADYWDAQVRQHPAIPVPPAGLPASHGALIRQLHAEEALGSLPDYRDDLLQRLLATYQEDTSVTATTTAASLPHPHASPPYRNATPQTVPVSRRRSATPPARTGWTLRPAVAIGLVILLVLASVGGVWFTTSRHDEPVRLLAPEVATPSADASPDVPMYRGNPARTGVFPGPALAGDPVELWTLQTGEPVNLGAAVVDGVLYIPAGTQGFEARDAMTSELVWAFATDAPAVSAPTVVDGLGYVIDNDGTLYAVNTADGTEAWRMANINIRSAPVVVDGLVYASTPEGTLYALEAATGAISWQAELGAESAGGMAVSDGVAFQGNATGALTAFDATTGEMMWTFQNDEGRGNATLTVANGQVYMTISGGDVNAMYAIDVATGELTWRQETGPGLGFISTTATPTILYSVAEDGKLHAMDAATGETVWEYQLLEFVRSIPVLVEDTLYVADNGGFVRALDAATGEPQWEYPIEGEVDLGWPVVSNGVLYIGTSFGTFYAITGSDMLATSDLETPADVPMFRGDPARTGGFPGPGINGAPEELWTAAVPGEVTTQAAIVDGVMYIGASNGGVYALDAATGDEVWNVTLPSAIDSSPAVSNGVIYIGSEDGTLHALTAEDGSEIWSLPIASPFVSPVIVDGTLYAGGSDGVLYALDPATGTERWQSPLGASVSRSPSVSDGVVYIGNEDSVLSTFDAATGEAGWSVQLEGTVLAHTAISDGVVYQGTYNGEAGLNYAYALDAATGEELWRFQIPDTELGYSSPAIGETLVYMPSQDGNIYALDRATGTVAWQLAAGDQFMALPALVGDTLYAASLDHTLYVLDAETGAEQWRYEADGPIGYGPVVTGGVAYFGTSFGTMYAITGSGVLAAPDVATPSIATPVASAATPAAAPATLLPAPTLSWESTGDPAQPLERSGVATIAPDGTIWVSDGGHSQFQIFAADGTWLESWGGAGQGSGDGQFTFERPNSGGDAFGAVAFAPDGTFYVADTGNQRIQHFDADRTFLNAWGGFGGEDGQFISPVDIAVDAEGDVYVGDDRREDLQVFAPDGTFLRAFGGNGDPEFQGWITLGSDDTIWGADGQQSLLHQWTGEGELLRAIPVTTGDGAPVIVGDVTFDSAGNMWVPDGDHGLYILLDPEGRWLAEWGEDAAGSPFRSGISAIDASGAGYGVGYDGVLVKYQFTPPVNTEATPATSTASLASTFAWQVGGSDGTLGQPDGLAIAPDGTLWVLDVATASLLQFDANGAPLDTIALNDAGAGAFDFAQPSGESYGALAIDADGNFYVLDMGNYRVVKLDPDGAYLLAMGERGTGDGQISIPDDVAVGPDGSVYIMDIGHRLVLQYTAAGEFVTAFGREGEVGNRIVSPAQIGVGPDGNIYVAEGPGGVKVFSPDGALVREFGLDETDLAIDVAVDANGTVYVTDASANDVKVFDPTGGLIGTIGGPGFDAGQFDGLASVAVDGTGGVYALDFVGKRVERFDLNAQSTASSATAKATPVATPAALQQGPTLLWVTTGGPETLDRTSDVTVAPDGTIWVADGGHSQFQLFAPDGTFLEAWGGAGQGSGDGQFTFERPNSDGDSFGAVAFAPDGTFYVADMGNRRIQHFSADREFLDTWGSFGAEDGQFISPIDIAVDSQGNVFVDDDKREDVQKFAPDGTFLLKFGGGGSEPGQLDFQGWMAISPTDHVWVVDGANGRIQEWDNDGRFLQAIEITAIIDEPSGIAIDASGRMFVTDFGGIRVVVLDANGAVLGEWGAPAGGDYQSFSNIAVDGGGNAYVLSYLDGTLLKYQLQPPLGEAIPVATAATARIVWESDDADADLSHAHGVTLAPDGTVWVADGANSRFQIFAQDGTLLEIWGADGVGAAEGQFNFVFANNGDGLGGVAFAPDGSFYVMDTGNNRIQHFDAERNFLNAWGSFGGGNGEFLSPYAIGIDSQGNVFVTDHTREDIQKFDANGTWLLTMGGSGSAPGKLDFQMFMAIAPDDTIWVADVETNKRIQHFGSDGSLIAAMPFADIPGEPVWVQTLAVDAAGRVYLADTDGFRMFVLNPDGTVLGTWSLAIADGSQFPNAGGMVVTDDGSIFLADWESGTLYRYELDPPLDAALKATPEASPAD